MHESSCRRVAAERRRLGEREGGRGLTCAGFAWRGRGEAVGRWAGGGRCRATAVSLETVGLGALCAAVCRGAVCVCLCATVDPVDSVELRRGCDEVCESSDGGACGTAGRGSTGRDGASFPWPPARRPQAGANDAAVHEASLEPKHKRWDGFAERPSPAWVPTKTARPRAPDELRVGSRCRTRARDDPPRRLGPPRCRDPPRSRPRSTAEPAQALSRRCCDK